MTETIAAPPAPPPDRARTGSLAAACAVAILAAVLVGVGCLALYGAGRRDADGFFSSGTHRFASARSAIATDDLEVDATGAGWIAGADAYGRLRVRVRPAGGRPVFVGIARAADVSRYLRGADHATLADLELDPFSTRYVDRPARRLPAAPSAQRFWAASATGAGAKTLTWDVRHGKWSLVVLHPDGAPGVAVDVRAGVDVRLVDDVARVGLGGGALAALLAAGLFARAFRRTRAAR